MPNPIATYQVQLVSTIEKVTGNFFARTVTIHVHLGSAVSCHSDKFVHHLNSTAEDNGE
jgi:hypothetical protein